MLRPLRAAELSDGTLRFLLWGAALLSPRPPSLMVLNEPETSLHPDLVAPLAGMIRSAARGTQVVVVTHSAVLREHLRAADAADAEGRSEATRDFVSAEIELHKQWGETQITGQTMVSAPPWDWGRR